jgi:glycosyltransferase involved in cell wall biosynthesis
MEMIVVDDASTDGSGVICREYGERDGRIRLITKQKNEGLSEARNTGISLARGAYLVFLDSDDRMDATMVEKMYQAMERNHSDMAICSNTQIDPKGKTIRHCRVPDLEQADQEEVLRLLCSGAFTCSAWAKMYRSELFQKVRFPKGKWYEDVFVFPKLLRQCRCVSCISDELVKYRIHGEAFTKREYTIGRMDIIEAFLDMHAYAKQEHIRFLEKETKITCYCRLIEAIKKCSFSEEEQQRIKKLRKQVRHATGLHIKYTPMVYVYFWMRKIR